MRPGLKTRNQSIDQSIKKIISAMWLVFGGMSGYLYFQKDRNFASGPVLLGFVYLRVFIMREIFVVVRMESSINSHGKW